MKILLIFTSLIFASHGFVGNLGWLQLPRHYKVKNNFGKQSIDFDLYHSFSQGNESNSIEPFYKKIQEFFNGLLDNSDPEEAIEILDDMELPPELRALLQYRLAKIRSLYKVNAKFPIFNPFEGSHGRKQKEQCRNASTLLQFIFFMKYLFIDNNNSSISKG